MSKHMKAAQFLPDTTTIGLRSIPIPEPKSDELLVKTVSSGLCHSDLVLEHRACDKMPADLE